MIEKSIRNKCKSVSMKNKMQNTGICFVAGCSGGHILPCLTLAQQERTKNPQLLVLFFTTNRTLDTKILASATDTVTHHVALPLSSITYGKWYKLPILFWHLTRSFFTSIHQLRKWHPTYVLTTGSHIAIPVCLAAWVLRIPVKLFEVNVLPGKTIKLLAYFAKEIFVCYAQTKNYLPAHKCILSNYPVKCVHADRMLSSKEALQIITAQETIATENHSAEKKLTPAKKTLLILGGSQGSLFLNQLIKKVLDSNTAAVQNNVCTAPEKHVRDEIQIIHQTGDLDQTDWKRFYAQRDIPALVFTYRNQMAPYYAAADTIICRAGAGTLAELIFFNKKSIVIPLETKATDHQLNNALACAKEHPELITVLRQNELADNTQKLESLLKKLLS